MKAFLLGLASIAAFTPPALSACPSSADLSRGFTLRGASVARIRDLGSHEIETANTYGGKTYYSTAYDGLFITSARGPDSETSYSYTGDDYHNFQLKVGSHIRYTMHYSDGFLMSASQTTDLTVIGLSEVWIGTCRYPTFTIFSKIKVFEDGWLSDPDRSGKEYRSKLDYSSELRTTLASHSFNEEGAPVDTTWSSIEANRD